MPRKPRAGTILEMAGGDEAKAAAVQRIIGMCGFDFLLWIESEADLWQRVTSFSALTESDQTTLYAEIERRCPPAVWTDHEAHRAAYQRTREGARS